MTRTPLLAAAALLLATPAVAQTAPASVDPAVHQKAMDLAALVDPASLLASANARLFEKHLDDVAARVPALRAIRTTDPAGYAAMASAGEKAARDDSLSAYPELQQNYAKLYEQDLSSDDLSSLLAYYRSPLGLKVVAKGYAAMNGSAEQDRAAARRTMVGELSPDERSKMMAFAATPAALHFHTLYQKRQQIGQSWVKSISQKLNEDSAQAMQSALRNHKRSPG